MFYYYYETHIGIETDVKVFNDGLVFIGAHYTTTRPDLL